MVSVITEGARVNHAALQMISRNSGGSYVNFERHSTSEAAWLLKSSAVVCTVNKSNTIEETYGAIYPAKGIHTIAGKFRGNRSEIPLNFSLGDRQISQQHYEL